MNAKEYLNQIGKLDKLIENKMQELNHWKCMALGTAGNMGGERVQSSGNQQKMADAICKYIDIEKDLTDAINKLISTRQEVIDTIEQLPAGEYDILHKRYVQGKDFFEISDMMDKSYSNVTTLHGRGLSRVQKIIDAREKNNRNV